MKNSNDAIGNRTRDLPAYSAVAHPTAPLRSPTTTTTTTTTTTIRRRRRRRRKKEVLHRKGNGAH